MDGCGQHQGWCRLGVQGAQGESLSPSWWGLQTAMGMEESHGWTTWSHTGPWQEGTVPHKEEVWGQLDPASGGH